MDLGTMGRKIKQHSYMSKKAFSDDLNLIWDNCLTYNTDPNHHLRRAAQIMRKKADQIMRRIPDRHERFTPSMIERFKFTTPDSATEKRGVLTNGINHDGFRVKREGTPTTGLLRGDSVVTDLTSGPGAAEDTASLDIGPSNDQTVAKPSEEVRFEDTPALERSSEDMAVFASLDAQLQALLENLNISDPESASLALQSMSQFNMEGADLHERLRQLAEEDEEPGVGRPNLPETSDEEVEVPILDVVVKRENSVDSATSEASRKRKRLDTISNPRKRSKRERLAERTLLENWWMAMASSSLAANTIPPTFDSAQMPNPLHPAFRPANASSPDVMATSPSKYAEPPRKSRTLHRLMSENVRVRKRARDIAIRIADQIEDEKQGVDPEDFSPLVPAEAESSHQSRKPWAQRAGLLHRRREPYLETDIGAIEAQDCMESVAMLVLQHANFDSSSVNALRVMGDLVGRCIENLGRSLKFLHETHSRKMTGEEMVLHALFANSISNMHELEVYIKSDIIKYGASLSNTLTSLEEVAAKRDEPVDEDAIFRDDVEVMDALGPLGEDIYGFRDLGLDTELGLKSLSVPKKLLRPKAKAVAAAEGADREAVKYPPPPSYLPLETQRIGAQIGLLRSYYETRVLALIPPPPPRPVVPVLAAPVVPRPPTPPAPVPTESVPAESSSPQTQPQEAAPTFDPYNPSALFIQVPKSTPTTASAPPKAPSPVRSAEMELMPIDGTAGAVIPLAEPPVPAEIPPILEDDVPDPSRVKVGPLGQIQVPSAATVAKQKRQHKAAAQAKAAAAAPPGTPVAAPLQSPVSASKPKKVTPKKPKPATVPSS
ncbi:SubName: Full=Uncharacterized protein {ECO:0000313/EMBL:CCA66425.1} [Serendipita indica DSM 11827]|uniref:Bromo domain-containing protein n=1 Tax=Serendipita indica (strain DSM 11827) TaxID=1109443 RepID=G4T4Y9_SERID|nr:SubName: Full=Uncharacterized protein {ECO:0000313/EMBL:CCA66425.1} [Serendipita indica DSM 11827]CCA66425.1 hypothetical protein PIIN_00111 [Serendipita indica DSM 11827]